MTIKTHKELRIWQEAHKLTIEVYMKTKLFPADERFGIISQLRRAAYSVPSNIVEGYSRLGQKDRKNFMAIARSSAKETAYFLELSGCLGYLSKEEAGILASRAEGLSAAIYAFIQKLN